MAPTTIEDSTHNQTHPTMSPTHSAIPVIVSCTRGGHDSTAALNPLSTFNMMPRISHFGKYQITTYLPKLQPVSDTAWRNKYGSDQLASTVYSLLDFHSVTDIITLRGKGSMSDLLGGSSIIKTSFSFDLFDANTNVAYPHEEAGDNNGKNNGSSAVT